MSNKNKTWSINLAWEIGKDDGVLENEVWRDLINEISQEVSNMAEQEICFNGGIDHVNSVLIIWDQMLDTKN